VSRRTTICCSAVALLALAKAPEPVPLVPVRAIWTLALNNQLALPPAYDESRAFFPIEHDRLVAYDIESGAQTWLVEAKPIVQPAVGGDMVFLADADGIAALGADDGVEAWRVPTTEPLAVRLVSDNGWLVAVTKSGTVLAFRAADGQLVWTRELKSPAHAAPALAADRVYVPTSDGRIVALQMADGAPVWERRVGGSPNEILVLDERLYVGSTDDFFYCVFTKDGRIDWRWRTGADVIGLPVADDRRVYFVSLDNVLRALHQTTGGQQWMRALPVRPTSGPALAGGTLVVAGQSRTIRTYNAKDGTPATEINAGAEVAAPPHVLPPLAGAPRLIFVTRDIVKGAVATLNIHTIEPTVTPLTPLPNPVMPGPMPATRP
jgi:outer membrane protein assembly factor BamB